jgi:hypothetical protein
MVGYGCQEVEGIWDRVGIIIHEYTVLQIAKINDPAENDNYSNVSLEWFMKRCAPSKSSIRSYERFRSNCRDFITAVRTARHKVISHSDLAAYELGVPVGAFGEGQDERYFAALHDVINENLEGVNLGPFPPWPQFIVDDTDRFMRKFTAAFSA